MSTRPKLQMNFRLLTACALALVLLTSAGCHRKVTPSPYQLGLEAYYRSLVSDASEAGLQQAIDDLNVQLRKSPADAGLLVLRASGNLDLLRLKVEGQGREFDTDRAQKLIRDLRLVQTLLQQAGDYPLWLQARVPTMAGDLLLLKASSYKPEANTDNEFRRQIVLISLYRLAADFYVHAGRSASSVAASISSDSALQAKYGVATQRELANAQDGYVNALSGMAQSEEFVGLNDRATQHLKEASGLLTASGMFPPQESTVLTPLSFYSYKHQLLATQASTLPRLESSDLTSTDALTKRLQGYELGLKEQIAANLFSIPLRSILQSDLTLDDNIQSVLGLLKNATPTPGS